MIKARNVWVRVINGGGLIFALLGLRLHERSYEHYEHLTSMLKPYEGIVSESSIAGFFYHCHNHLCIARVRVVTQTERAPQPHDFLMTELLGTHSLFTAVNRRLSDWSVVDSGLNLSSDWLIVWTQWSKPIKTHWQRLIAFTHFARIGILTQLDSGQPAFQALHGDLTDTNQQRRGSYKEERRKLWHTKCHNRVKDLQRHWRRKATHQQDLKLKIEDTNTRPQLQKREYEEAEEKAPIFLYKSSSKQQEATRKSTSPPPSSIASK